MTQRCLPSDRKHSKDPLWSGDPEIVKLTGEIEALDLCWRARQLLILQWSGFARR